MYYKILQTRKVQKIDKFYSKLVSSMLSLTNTLALKNTLAYFEICTLRTKMFLKCSPRGLYYVTNYRYKPECFCAWQAFPA